MTNEQIEVLRRVINLIIVMSVLGPLLALFLFDAMGYMLGKLNTYLDRRHLPDSHV